MEWKKALKLGQELVLATSSKNGKPRNIFVISLGLVNNKLLIGACQMKTSLQNIKNNNKISIAVKNKNNYYRIDGSVKIYTSGKYFAMAKKISRDIPPKHALVVNIKEAFDLDKIKKLY